MDETPKPVVLDHEKEISITRALVELKNIDSRIQSQISKSVFVTYRGENVEPKTGIDKAANSFQSISDLLERRVKIKSAITISNATTKVKICGREMTIAEAIEMKSSIRNYQRLRAELRSQYADATDKVETINANVKKDLDRILREGKDISGKLTEGYLQMNKVKLYDPINVVKKLETIENFITSFEGDIDATLSETNARTMVVI